MCAIVATYEPLVEVAERLNEIVPGDFAKKTLLTSTGAEAVEAAVGLARYHSGRQGIVTFEGGYHGRSSLTMAMTSKFALFKKGFGPYAPEVYRFPFPDLYRCPAEFSEEQWLDWHLEKLAVFWLLGAAYLAPSRRLTGDSVWWMSKKKGVLYEAYALNRTRRSQVGPCHPVGGRRPGVRGGGGEDCV